MKHCRSFPMLFNTIHVSKPPARTLAIPPPPVSREKVRDFQRMTGGSSGSRGRAGPPRLDFPSFVKAYAWIFYNDRGGDGDSSGDSTNDSVSSSSNRKRGRGRQTTQNVSHAGARGKRGDIDDDKPRKLGYAERNKRGGIRGREKRLGSGGGIGEEAELRRWEKRLGDKQMRRLERVFDEWAVEDRDGDGATVEVRDLGRCFKELGKTGVLPGELRAWCDEVDLAPGDFLSLADFAYAYHSMFVDAGGRGKCLYYRCSRTRSSAKCAPLLRHKQDNVLYTRGDMSAGSQTVQYQKLSSRSGRTGADHRPQLINPLPAAQPASLALFFLLNVRMP